MIKCQGCNMEFWSEPAYDLHFPIFHEGEDWDKIKNIYTKSDESEEEETMFEKLKEKFIRPEVDLTKQQVTEIEIKEWKYKVIVEVFCDTSELASEITRKINSINEDRMNRIDIRELHIKKIEVEDGKER